MVREEIQNNIIIKKNIKHINRTIKIKGTKLNKKYIIKYLGIKFKID